MSEGELYRLPEVPIEEIDHSEFEIVYAALHNSESQYRTIGSIHRQTGLDPARIASMLTNSEMARKSVLHKDGESLFAPADRPKQRKEKILEFLARLPGNH